MPTLHWTGKEAVQNHHHTLPVRTLLLDAPNSHAKNVEHWQPNLDDNLIITADNLEAMKALLPKHAGKVDVIYIDPPYNTGNEGWVYNDNVNSPAIKSWLGKTVGKDGEDLERHDKWLCMMHPRLQLMKQLLNTETGGVIFISIDDNEVANLRLLMDEIFGEHNFVAQFVWRSKQGKGGTTEQVDTIHEYLISYSVNRNSLSFKKELKISEGGKERLRQWGQGDSREDRPSMFYSIKTDDDVEIFPIKDDGTMGRWRVGVEKMNQLLESKQVIFEKSKSGKIEAYKLIPKGKETPLCVDSLISNEDSSTTAYGTKELKIIFDDKKLFDYPKPTKLLYKILGLIELENAIILDAFAGSGTTAHATLKLNAEDGGNRKFILIQQPETLNEGSPAHQAGFTTVDAITRERVKRVIEGVPTAKDAQLKAGLGGSFTAVTLGSPIELANLPTLPTEALPTYEQLAQYVFYHTTLQALPTLPSPNRLGYIGQTATHRVYLLYQADRTALTTTACALTLELAEAMANDCKATQQEAIVYAPVCFADTRILKAKQWPVRFCNLPYDLLQLEPVAPASSSLL
ncbi:MAG: site-specific DNA-methyltransferase [Vampirovibrionales bacterium]